MASVAEPRLNRKASAWWRRLPSGIAGAVFWLALWFGLLWLFRQVPSGLGSLLGWMQILVGVALLTLAVPLGWKLVHERLLWSLRNKLTLTYLLIGLAPVVLFVTLVAISAYVAAGQFSIHLADTRLRQQLEEIGMDNSARASRMARVMRDGNPLPAGGRLGPPPNRSSVRGNAARTPEPAPVAPAGAPGTTNQENGAQTTTAPVVALGEMPPNPLLEKLHRHSAMYLSGVPLYSGVPGAQPVNSGVAGTGAPASPSAIAGVPLGLPAWASDLHGNQFRQLVLDGQDLFLVAIDQRHIEGKGVLTVITSLPVNGALVDVLAEGLGQVRLSGLMTGPAHARQTSLRTDLEHASVYGGTEPKPVYFCDIGVPFVSTMDIVDWDTGQADNVPIEVHSRPSLLYRQLFGSSLGGIVTSYIRFGLIGLCILFAIIESIALWAALRLSRAITHSVEELYSATQRVDRGEFGYRIAAVHAAKKDQLGELARSFNRMTGSLERLMIEQHEKERLQSELSIAQEVQANLFPRHVRDLQNLQLHGICRPARSVSGDYYDFLIFHHPDEHGLKGAEAGVGIALGDISGKGISAALLMATLHSAVRAYRLASEDLVYSESTIGALTARRDGAAGDSGKLFESPARILSLLNRHLYRSTQPEKYATLFLAHYDAATSRLTYANAGHLPPLVLSRDGKVRRLDCGGTVVGLMDGMRYSEEAFHLESGDILVAYSDGITEPENDFGEFGEARLMEVVARYRDQPLAVISAQVMLALDAWIGAGEQPDDMTLVLARQI